ncbi:uncharacterized protein LOC119403455 [Rhipicephalus sanguineus]|uniref:uncharacterized protein LOC119403455 n=1 Tax=Rhipicephalus sanguineus TaxID=34632 RepID=UPI0020C2305B|nr:uncharacterized protein LOC119403455 [Rhipicephalus sanguineus]
MYHYLMPKATSATPSYYVIGVSLDDITARAAIVNLMRTVFGPSMFIAISHITYPLRTFSDCRIFPLAMEDLPEGLTRGRDYTYGHTVNESLLVLREVLKQGLSIPFAISFGLKGVHYVPKTANSNPLFQPCRDHQAPFYDDPSTSYLN